MSHSIRSAALLLALGLAAVPGPQAQPYRSALEDYRPFADDSPVPWKQANDTVGRIGGWRAYAKEVHGAPASAPAAPAKPPASAPAAAPARPAQPAHKH